MSKESHGRLVEIKARIAGGASISELNAECAEFLTLSLAELRSSTEKPTDVSSVEPDDNLPKLTGWEMAIKDAERRIRALKAALVLFKQKRDAGEPWPGD